MQAADLMPPQSWPQQFSHIERVGKFSLLPSSSCHLPLIPWQETISAALSYSRSRRAEFTPNKVSILPQPHGPLADIKDIRRAEPRNTLTLNVISLRKITETRRENHSRTICSHF